MTEFCMIEAKKFHCGQMVRRLRVDHLAAVHKLGVNTHKELRRHFDDSGYRRALMINGKLAALGGVTGTALSSTGMIWLAITDEAARYPHHLAKICLRHLEEILTVKRELSTFILPADEASFRFAKFMGFVTLRNSPVDIGEGQAIPMVIRRERKVIYTPTPAEHAVLH